MIEGAEQPQSKSLSQCVIVEDWNLQFSSYNLMAGSTLTLIGENIVAFVSDKPLECMTLYYDKDPN